MENYFSSGGRPQSGVTLTSLILDGVQSRGIASVLEVIRQHLEMDVAFISRFGETHRVMEHVAPMELGLLPEGLTLPVEQGYCLLVTRG